MRARVRPRRVCEGNTNHNLSVNSNYKIIIGMLISDYLGVESVVSERARTWTSKARGVPGCRSVWKKNLSNSNFFIKKLTILIYSCLFVFYLRMNFAHSSCLRFWGFFALLRTAAPDLLKASLFWQNLWNHNIRFCFMAPWMFFFFSCKTWNENNPHPLSATSSQSNSLFENATARKKI